MKDINFGIRIEHVNKGSLVTRGLNGGAEGQKQVLAIHPDGFYAPCEEVGGLQGFRRVIDAADAINSHLMGSAKGKALELRTGIALAAKSKNPDLDKDDWTVAEDRTAVWQRVSSPLSAEVLRRLVVLSILEGKYI